MTGLIYSGLLLAFIGTALARAEWRSVLAVALAFRALRRKRRIEERWMREQFGAAYEDYTRRVAPSSRSSSDARSCVGGVTRGIRRGP